jgi:hypothetical protein
VTGLREGLGGLFRVVVRALAFHVREITSILTSHPGGAYMACQRDRYPTSNEEYRRKYGRPSAVEHITSPKAQTTTHRIVQS